MVWSTQHCCTQDYVDFSPLRSWHIVFVSKTHNWNLFCGCYDNMETALVGKHGYVMDSRVMLNWFSWNINSMEINWLTLCWISLLLWRCLNWSRIDLMLAALILDQLRHAYRNIMDSRIMLDWWMVQHWLNGLRLMILNIILVNLPSMGQNQPTVSSTRPVVAQLWHVTCVHEYNWLKDYVGLLVHSWLTYPRPLMINIIPVNMP